MLKKNITYTNFDGETVTEEFCFNLTKAEVMKMQLGTVGGYTEKISKLLGVDPKATDASVKPENIKNENVPEIVNMFERIILDSYGKKVFVDGHYIFMKSESLKNEFMYSEAYSQLFMELIENPESAKAFMEAVLPNTDKTVPAVAK